MSYPETIDVDVDDDLNRELALYVFATLSSIYLLTMSNLSYKQALHGAQTARSLAQKHNFPFTRPADYFAEMVKSDSHMERIRQRLLDESAGLKRAEEKRKEREGKKFGKQVQLEKIKERQQSKKEIEERLKGLKRSECPLFFTSPHAHIPHNGACRSHILSSSLWMRDIDMTSSRTERCLGWCGRRRGLRRRSRGRHRRPPLKTCQGAERQGQAPACGARQEVRLRQRRQAVKTEHKGFHRFLCAARRAGREEGWEGGQGTTKAAREEQEDGAAESDIVHLLSSGPGRSFLLALV